MEMATNSLEIEVQTWQHPFQAVRANDKCNSELGAKAAT